MKSDNKEVRSTLDYRVRMFEKDQAFVLFAFEIVRVILIEIALSRLSEVYNDALLSFLDAAVDDPEEARRQWEPHYQPDPSGSDNENNIDWWRSPGFQIPKTDWQYYK